MKHLVCILFIILYAFESFAQTNVIKSTNIPKSSNAVSTTIKNRTAKDAEINRIDRELNMYKGNTDGYSMQKSMELEKQKIDVRNK